MTMNFAPHVRHIADQERDNQQAEAEYVIYEQSVRALEENLRMALPRIPRDEFNDMRDLLAARHGVSV